MSVSFLYLILICCGFVHKSLCQTSLSSQDQQELLNAHNHYRGLVNPTASNMQTMVWNAELAMVAQSYAEQCVFEHNANRVSQQSTFRSVGENLAATTGSANYTGLVRNWYDENQYYDYSSNSCAQGEVCGHYTQVVWATSSSLGCGAFRCAQLTGFVPNALNLVCNYGPAGNFVGRSPYTSGTPCSACPQGLNFCVQNLCSATAASTMEESGITTNANSNESTSGATAYYNNATAASTMEESGITTNANSNESTSGATAYYNNGSWIVSSIAVFMVSAMLRFIM